MYSIRIARMLKLIKEYIKTCRSTMHDTRDHGHIVEYMQRISYVLIALPILPWELRDGSFVCAVCLYIENKTECGM